MSNKKANKIKKFPSIYERNLSALQELYPPIAEWLKAGQDVPWLRHEGNQLWIQIKGAEIAMYPEQDHFGGLAELDKIVHPHKENVTVILGTGLGHAIAHLVKKAEKGHMIVVVEPVAHMMRLMLSKYDLTTPIRNRTLFLCATEADAEGVLGAIESIKVVEDWGILVEKTANERPEYWKVTQAVLEILNQIQHNTGTVSSAGAQIADNDIATLPYVIQHRGVQELANLYKGLPAVVVCTGPSLERNIHLLQTYKDNVIIIAVAQALRPLLAYGIRPDFICTVDFGEVNMTHLAGLLDEDVPLVTINKAYAPMIRCYKGPKFISNSNQGEEGTAHGALNDKGMLAQGGSVAHMAFGLAVNLGCSPVMLMGMDLALSERSHFQQADSAGRVEVTDGIIKWVVDDPRSKTLHERQDITMGPAVKVPAWWGGDVLTNTGLCTFITAMERLVEQSAVPVIDCTEGGARKKGTKRMVLTEALSEYSNAILDKSAINPLLSLPDNSDQRVKDLLPLLNKDIQIINKLIEHADKALETVKQLRATKDERRLLELFKENAKHSTVAQEGAKRLPTVGLAIYWASRKIQRRELNVEADPKRLSTRQYVKERLIRLDRNELILKTAKEAALSLKKTYEESKAVVLDYLQGKPSALTPTGDPDKPNLNDAEHYLSTGAFAKPYLEAMRVLQLPEGDYKKAHEVIAEALKIRESRIEAAQKLQSLDEQDGKYKIPRYLDLCDEGLLLGRDKKKYDEALTKLQAAVELIPDREEARWGMASALYAMKDFTKAIDEYKRLVADFPDTPIYHFEFGQALIQADSLKDGIKEIRIAMTQSDEFEYFRPVLEEVEKAIDKINNVST